MTVGLAAYDNDGIHISMESKGTGGGKGPRDFVIYRKITTLQNSPQIRIMMSGGMDHWKQCLLNYSPQNTIEEAASYMKAFFDANLIDENTICCYLFTYDNAIPRYIHLLRDKNTKETVVTLSHNWQPAVVLPIGWEPSALAAKAKADELILALSPIPNALSEAIEFVIAKNLEHVHPPVITETFQK